MSEKPDNVERSSKCRIDEGSICVITKAHDRGLVCLTRQLAEWLITTPRFGKEHPFTVYVDEHLKQSKAFRYHQLVEANSLFATKLKFWTPKDCRENPDMFQIVITLGGDGTVLFASWLFQFRVPPVIPFHLGSLNFLAPFPYTAHNDTLRDLFENGFETTLRMRLSCTVYRGRVDKSTTSSYAATLDKCKLARVETCWMKSQLSREVKRVPNEAERAAIFKHIPLYIAAPCETYEVLNELVVDRGPNSYMSVLELFGDERHLTTVQADGLVIATPTGSTAYSLSANGPLTHPEIHATLVTPICPHTLSFRPMILPESMAIRVFVPFSSSRSAYCSFDGRNRIELKPGDHVRIVASQYPLPTAARMGPNDDWFSSLQSSLTWNVRTRQKSFLVVESSEGPNAADAEYTMATDQEEEVFGCLRDTHTPSSLNGSSGSGESGASMADIDNDDDDDDEDPLPGWSEFQLRRTFSISKC
ncbi:ATP-NAD kinase-like domain-containing protein [Dichotomocladium elegans]|nr:ATP-NAD kinase-like domain-containing protein [Dichotomocladium elegans]